MFPKQEVLSDHKEEAISKKIKAHGLQSSIRLRKYSALSFSN
jgi:hypothetical protein